MPFPSGILRVLGPDWIMFLFSCFSIFFANLPRCWKHHGVTSPVTNHRPNAQHFVLRLDTNKSNAQSFVILPNISSSFNFSSKLRLSPFSLLSNSKTKERVIRKKITYVTSSHAAEPDRITTFLRGRVLTFNSKEFYSYILINVCTRLTQLSRPLPRNKG